MLFSTYDLVLHTNLSEPARDRRCGWRGRLLLMGAACLVAPPCWSWSTCRGGELDVSAIAGGWALLFLLVVLRIVGLVREIERAEAERRRLLGASVAQASPGWSRPRPPSAARSRGCAS